MVIVQRRGDPSHRVHLAYVRQDGVGRTQPISKPFIQTLRAGGESFDAEATSLRNTQAIL